jgi:glycosyltransferase involved in cell wall biosynthesis
MEAVGNGLAMIGFDVPYGNPTFIDDGKNGFLIPVPESMTEEERVRALADRVVRYFTECDRTAFERRSYEIAEAYRAERVARKWKGVIDRR